MLARRGQGRRAGGHRDGLHGAQLLRVHGVRDRQLRVRGRCQPHPPERGGRDGRGRLRGAHYPGRPGRLCGLPVRRSAP